MLSTPRIPPGRAELSWRREAGGDLYYYVRGPSGQPIRLNPGMLVIALMADGERTLAAIYEAVRAAGLTIDDPAVVVMTFRRLEPTGALEMAWHFETLAPIRHECLGCGRSCEGHLIGPLSDGEVERLVTLKARLEAEGVDLPAGDPVVLFETSAGPRPALNTRSGRCIFLDAEARCLLHAHFGSTSKPLKCQLFPLRVVETEDGFRVGISSRCALAHRSYRHAPPTTPSEELAARKLRRPPGDIVSLNPTSPRSLRATPVAEQNRIREDAYLALLGGPDVSLTEVVLSGSGERRRGSALPEPFRRRLATVLRRFGERYQCDPLNQPGTAFGDGVRRFLAALRRLPELPEWREPPEPVSDYLRHALRQFVFLRATVPFGRVWAGFQVAAIGAIGAVWVADPLHEDDGAPSDCLAEYLSYWLRLFNGARALPFLFDSPSELPALGRLLGVEVEAP